MKNMKMTYCAVVSLILVMVMVMLPFTAMAETRTYQYEGETTTSTSIGGSLIIDVALVMNFVTSEHYLTAGIKAELDVQIARARELGSKIFVIGGVSYRTFVGQSQDQNYASQRGLGERRAKEVVKYILSHGVEAEIVNIQVSWLIGEGYPGTTRSARYTSTNTMINQGCALLHVRHDATVTQVKAIFNFTIEVEEGDCPVTVSWDRTTRTLKVTVGECECKTDPCTQCDISYEQCTADLNPFFHASCKLDRKQCRRTNCMTKKERQKEDLKTGGVVIGTIGIGLAIWMLTCSTAEAGDAKASTCPFQ